MKIETRKIAKVYDQTDVPETQTELLVLGPEVAWAFDRATADLFARSRGDHRGDRRRYKVVEDHVEILLNGDEFVARLDMFRPLDPASEKKAARAALLARLSPEERALLEET